MREQKIGVVSVEDQTFGPDDSALFVVSTPEVRRKYLAGDSTKRWGEPDEFNDDFQDAVRAGLIDAEGHLTELGVDHLEKEDKPVVAERTPLPISGETKDSNIASLKQLQDDIHAIVGDRGFHVEDIQVFPHPQKGPGGESRFGLKITFFHPRDRGGDGKKRRGFLELVGSHDDLMATMSRHDLALPVTEQSRRFRRYR